MTIGKTNVITGHEVNLLPPTADQPEPFGWIRLLNGSKDAGYIYLQAKGPWGDPHLSSDGTYIVTAMPISSFSSLLDVLRNEKNLQIRFHDPQSTGISPSVFIEPATENFQSINGTFRAAAEIAAEVRKLLNPSVKIQEPRRLKLTQENIQITMQDDRIVSFFFPFEEGFPPGKVVASFRAEKRVWSVIAGVTQLSPDGTPVIGEADLRIMSVKFENDQVQIETINLSNKTVSAAVHGFYS